MTGRDLLDELEAQESRLVFDRFDDDTAWELGSALRKKASARGLPIAISVRRNGRLLFFAALPGSSADNEAWLARKCAVVDRYGHSSLRVGEQFRVDGKSFDEAPGSIRRRSRPTVARSRSWCAAPDASGRSPSPGCRSSRTTSWSWTRSRTCWNTRADGSTGGLCPRAGSAGVTGFRPRSGCVNTSARGDGDGRPDRRSVPLSGVRSSDMAGSGRLDRRVSAPPGNNPPVEPTDRQWSPCSCPRTAPEG